MVLEELDRPPNGHQEAPFAESLPSSDVDPYAGDHSPTILDSRESSYVAVNSPPHQIYVNLANLPRRWGPFTWMDRTMHPPPVVKGIQDTCREASKILQRPLRQEEADALAFHLTKAVRVSSYGTPIGMAIASAVAYRGISKYRFPGYTPGETFNPEKFGPIKGHFARTAWQMARFNAYWFLGGIIGSLFFSSYGMTLSVAGRAMDPRLKEMVEVLTKRQKSGVGSERPGNREVDQTAGPREGETTAMARQRQRAQEAANAWKTRKEQKVLQQQQQKGDMSPTGGAFGAEYADLGSANVMDTGMMSDDQARQSMQGLENKQREDYSRKVAETVGPSRPQQQHQRSDDASPTPAATSKQSGSVWERLRQQAASGQNQSSPRGPPARRQEPSSTSGDGFSFSSNDEEKGLAHAHAQKEFDARIERERTGKDFDDRTPGNRKW